MTSEPVLCFQVLGENSVIRLLDLVGPEDPHHITAVESDAVRARYGTDKIRNGIYVSSSAELARRVIIYRIDFKIIRSFDQILMLLGQSTTIQLERNSI